MKMLFHKKMLKRESQTAEAVSGIIWGEILPKALKFLPGLSVTYERNIKKAPRYKEKVKFSLTEGVQLLI
jgi:hypothetical protein